VGIFCGDYSICRIERNSVSGTMPDRESGDRTRGGVGIVSHYWADVTVADNRLRGNTQPLGAFLDARISSAD
jgi:hypothetical protein